MKNTGSDFDIDKNEDFVESLCSTLEKTPPHPLMVRNVYTSGPGDHPKYGFSVSNATLSDGSQDLSMTYNFRGGYVSFTYNNVLNQTERRSQHTSPTPKYIREKLKECINDPNSHPFVKAIIKLIDYDCEIVINSNYTTHVNGNIVTYEGLETHEPYRNLSLIKEYGRLLKDIKHQIKTMPADSSKLEVDKVFNGSPFPEYILTLNLKPTE